MGEEQCTVRFYAVFAVVRASNGNNWCIVKEMSRAASGYSTGERMRQSSSWADVYVSFALSTSATSNVA